MMEGGFGFASVGTNAGGLRALVIGATGATGKSLVARLASMHEYSKVGTISRRSVDYEEADKVTQHIVDMASVTCTAVLKSLHRCSNPTLLT